MKYFLRISLAVFSALFACQLFAQTGGSIDQYLGTKPNVVVISNSQDGVAFPQDLKFSTTPSRKNELWVLNYGDYNAGGYMVLFFNAGKANQKSQLRHDSHAQHFMIYPTAFAFGTSDSEYFATIGEALNNTGDATSTFMGPVLWDSDTTKYARI
ncbi:MAG: hypothetical protein ABI778_04040, partial [Ignavibacteriota bacterium]